MPVGANDFAVDCYSYDEMPNDFDLKHFSISRILKILSHLLKARCNISQLLGFEPQHGAL